MNSPVAPTTQMMKCEIEPRLFGFQCPVSGGFWIPLQEYLLWIERRAETFPTENSANTPELLDDSSRSPLFCPESGAILLRYRVGHGLEFQVDRSPITGGVWLDQGEWDALKARGLHKELHLIFTAPYQQAVRAEAFREHLVASFRNRLGSEDFEKAQAFKQWMMAHEKGSDIRAYLMDRELS